MVDFLCVYNIYIFFWYCVYLGEFAMQHLEFCEFPLDAPATVGRLLSFYQAHTHTVTSNCLASLLCSLDTKTSE